MSALTLERVRREGEALMESVSREHYLAHAGLKPTAELQPIYQRHAGILDGDALQLARAAFLESPEGSEARRRGRLLLDWQVDAQCARALAPLEEREIAWESTAMLTLADGRRIPYQRAAIDLANAQERGERMLIEEARASLVARELAPLRLERFQREIALVLRLDIAPTYVGTFEALSGVSLSELGAQCRAFLRDTQDMWDESVREMVRRRLGIAPGEATRADALALLRAPELDRFFPASGMEASVRRQMRDMAIDAEAGGRIRYDTGERDGKRSRAFCAPVRVPDEVYLVLRPHGGQTDYRTLLHELGHALHFANTRPDHPFEYRWLGDNSVTEGYAMLLDHLMHSAGWLTRYTELTRADVGTVLRAVGFEELQFLRRYCAKLLYELELFSGTHSWESLPDLYVSTLSDATSFRYDPADAFVDVDPRFYAARYLRAWQLQALLGETLIERFDEDWYRNPRAGPWLVSALFAEGQRELADELAVRVADRSLSFDPLVRAAESLLVAS